MSPFRHVVCATSLPKRRSLSAPPREGKVVASLSSSVLLPFSLLKYDSFMLCFTRCLCSAYPFLSFTHYPAVPLRVSSGAFLFFYKCSPLVLLAHHSSIPTAALHRPPPVRSGSPPPSLSWQKWTSYRAVIKSALSSPTFPLDTRAADSWHSSIHTFLPLRTLSFSLSLSLSSLYYFFPFLFTLNELPKI